MSAIANSLTAQASAEALYRQLGAVAADLPTFAGSDPTPDQEKWLARAYALVEASGDLMEAIEFKKSWRGLRGQVWTRESSETMIRDTLGRALAKAELRAPAAAQGAFVAAGSSFDAYQVVRKVLITATKDLLIVDPYLNEVVMTDFAPLVPETVAIRLLADSASQAASQSLKAAVQRWVSQYGGSAARGGACDAATSASRPTDNR